MATQEQRPEQLYDKLELGKGFTLGAWLIRPNAGQIEKDGVKLHIEPKLVEVLLLLAVVPGQVVSREELLDHAWRRQVVCDDALTRAISELRTLLGDTGRERQYIRTVPKRGYALIADVALLPQTESANTVVTEDDDNPNTPNVPVATPMSRFTRVLQYWLYGVGSLATLSAAIFAVIVLTDDVRVGVLPNTEWSNMQDELGIAGKDSQLLTPSLPELKSFAVLPFTNLTPDQNLDFFTDGLEEDIRATLALLADAQVAGRLASNQFLTQQQNKHSNTGIVQDIAQQLQVDAILDGTVRLIDGDVRVTVQLLDGRSGFPLWTKRYDKKFSNLLKLQTFIADNVHCELESRLTKKGLLAEDETRFKALNTVKASKQEFGHTRHIEWLAR